MGTDTIKLREDVMLAQKEAAQLGAALAKANARIEYLTGEKIFVAREVLLISTFRSSSNGSGADRCLHPRN
jgi:nucleoprotein TPR